MDTAGIDKKIGNLSPEFTEIIKNSDSFGSLFRSLGRYIEKKGTINGTEVYTVCRLILYHYLSVFESEERSEIFLSMLKGFISGYIELNLGLKREDDFDTPSESK